MAAERMREPAAKPVREDTNQTFAEPGIFGRAFDSTSSSTSQMLIERGPAVAGRHLSGRHASRLGF